MILNKGNLMKTVQETIKAMLTERVAHSMGDSGGAYGYIHEKNESRDFENEPQVSVDLTDINKGETSNAIDYSISVYHYLTSVLEFNDRTEEINDSLKSARDFYDDGNEDKIDYPHWSQECVDIVTNILNEDDILDFGETINTCNHESSLDQVLQYTPFVINEEDHYILLQIHGGCDVRGGYTDAMCFSLEDLYGCEMAMLPIEDVYGNIDSYQCSNLYDGCTITSDGETQGEEIELEFNSDGECISDVSLYLMEH